MSVVHTSRPAGIAEIAAEMDRRGTVIEGLEARLNALVAAAKALADPDCYYDGNNIVIRCDSHGDAMRRMRLLRGALERAAA